MRFAKILCPVDFSDASHEALLAAVRLAREFDATLTILHVYSLPVVAVPEMSLNPAIYDQILKSAEEGLARWTREASQLGAHRVDSAKLEGVPWDVIVKVAREGGADVVILGTHGRTGLRHALLGSVAERVVRHAPCPVLVVRPAAGTH
jgi:nucleotide-binding universal stress UspA family protein